MLHSISLLFVSVGFALAIMLIIRRMNLLEHLFYSHMENTEDKLSKICDTTPTLDETEHLRKELKSIHFKIEMLEGIINDKTSVDEGNIGVVKDISKHKPPITSDACDTKEKPKPPLSSFIYTDYD